MAEPQNSEQNTKEIVYRYCLGRLGLLPDEIEWPNDSSISGSASKDKPQLVPRNVCGESGSWRARDAITSILANPKSVSTPSNAAKDSLEKKFSGSSQIPGPIELINISSILNPVLPCHGELASQLSSDDEDDEDDEDSSSEDINYFADEDDKNGPKKLNIKHVKRAFHAASFAIVRGNKRASAAAFADAGSDENVRRGWPNKGNQIIADEMNENLYDNDDTNNVGISQHHEPPLVQAIASICSARINSLNEASGKTAPSFLKKNATIAWFHLPHSLNQSSVTNNDNVVPTQPPLPQLRQTCLFQNSQQSLESQLSQCSADTRIMSGKVPSKEHERPSGDFNEKYCFQTNYISPRKRRDFTSVGDETGVKRIKLEFGIKEEVNDGTNNKDGSSPSKLDVKGTAHSKDSHAGYVVSASNNTWSNGQSYLRSHAPSLGAFSQNSQSSALKPGKTACIAGGPSSSIQAAANIDNRATVARAILCAAAAVVFQGLTPDFIESDSDCLDSDVGEEQVENGNKISFHGNTRDYNQKGDAVRSRSESPFDVCENRGDFSDEDNQRGYFYDEGLGNQNIHASSDLPIKSNNGDSVDGTARNTSAVSGGSKAVRIKKWEINPLDVPQNVKVYDDDVTNDLRRVSDNEDSDGENEACANNSESSTKKMKIRMRPSNTDNQRDKEVYSTYSHVSPKENKGNRPVPLKVNMGAVLVQAKTLGNRVLDHARGASRRSDRRREFRVDAALSRMGRNYLFTQNSRHSSQEGANVFEMGGKSLRTFSIGGGETMKSIQKRKRLVIAPAYSLPLVIPNPFSMTNTDEEDIFSTGHVKFGHPYGHKRCNGVDTDTDDEDSENEDNYVQSHIFDGNNISLSKNNNIQAEPLSGGPVSVPWKKSCHRKRINSVGLHNYSESDTNSDSDGINETSLLDQQLEEARMKELSSRSNGDREWTKVCLPRLLAILRTGAGHAILHDVEWHDRSFRVADLLRNLATSPDMTSSSTTSGDFKVKEHKNTVNWVNLCMAGRSSSSSVRKFPNYGPHLIVTASGDDFGAFAAAFGQLGYGLRVFTHKNSCDTGMTDGSSHNYEAFPTDPDDVILRVLPYHGPKSRRRSLRKHFGSLSPSPESSFCFLGGLPDSPFHVILTTYSVFVEDYVHFCQIPFQVVIMDDGMGWLGCAHFDPNGKFGKVWKSGLWSNCDYGAGMARVTVGRHCSSWDFSKDDGGIETNGAGRSHDHSSGGASTSAVNGKKDSAGSSLDRNNRGKLLIGITARHRVLLASSMHAIYRGQVYKAPVPSLLSFLTPQFTEVVKR